LVMRRMQQRLDESEWAALAEQRDAADHKRIFNTATDWDYVECYGTVTSDRLADCCRFLASALFEPEPDEEGFKEAIGSISRLIEEGGDGARAQGSLPGLREAHALLRRAMSGGRDEGLPLYGTAETIRGLGLDDVTAFHRKYYVPQNVFVSIVSPLPAEEATALARKAFGKWEKSGTPVPAPKPPERLAAGVEVTGSKSLREAFVRGEDVACLMVGVHIPTAPEKEACAGDVIHAILGRPRGRIQSDRELMRSLPEVYFLGPIPRGDPPKPTPAFSTSPAPGADRIDSIRTLLSRTDTVGAYLAVQVWTDPVKLDDAKAKIIAHLAALARQPPGEDELRAAKDFAINVYARAHETKRDVAWLLARREILGQDAAADESYARTVESLTAADIQQTAQKYLTVPSVAVVLPLSE
ncbi:MAG: M16 family metallopeptidase, partial [Armatimonadota bacterium]